jgi:hypothetical protein
MANPNVIERDIPGVGKVMLVDREKLRRRTDRRFFRKMAAKHPTVGEPVMPVVTDVSNGEKIKYPILGNGRVGDCYYAAALHMVQSFLGQYGAEPNWNENDVIARYEVLSGGDNGLSDDDIYPEWIKGILGPNGPNKIVDSLLISPTDTATIKIAIWRFTGVLLTISLSDNFDNNASPGATWDQPSGNFVGGHAIILTGANAKGGFDLRTWGISPPINITPRGIAGSDPEIIVVFSPEQYNPETRLSAAGFTWEEDRQLWIQYGGKDVGPAPWGPPPPPPIVPPVVPPVVPPIVPPVVPPIVPPVVPPSPPPAPINFPVSDIVGSVAIPGPFGVVHQCPIVAVATPRPMHRSPAGWSWPPIGGEDWIPPLVQPWEVGDWQNTPNKGKKMGANWSKVPADLMKLYQDFPQVWPDVVQLLTDMGVPIPNLG